MRLSGTLSLTFMPGIRFCKARSFSILDLCMSLKGTLTCQGPKAFCTPPFRDPNQERPELYPVRAPDAYVHKAALWHRSDQLFVCFGWQSKGFSGHQADAEQVGGRDHLTCLQGLWLSVTSWSQSNTRQEVASKAFSLGARGWSSPHTFVRFYNLDLASSVVSHTHWTVICHSGAVGIHF